MEYCCFSALILEQGPEAAPGLKRSSPGTMCSISRIIAHQKGIPARDTGFLTELSTRGEVFDPPEPCGATFFKTTTRDESSSLVLDKLKDKSVGFCHRQGVKC